jgi:DNA-binding transcriptional LysR family regulator
MDLRQLRYFTVLARELHFGRAAAALHITQPPLTRQIQELERQLGAVLFDRTNRSVKLTEPGKVFLTEVSHILQLLDQAKETVARAERGELGRLAVGYIGSAAYSLLPRALRELRRTHPDVELALIEMTTPDQCDALSSGTIDAAIMRPSLAAIQFDTAEIVSEPFAVALPSDHPMARTDEIHIRQLRNEGFIMLPSTASGGLPGQVRELCLRAKFEPKVVQVANQTLSILGLVGSGAGIAIVPGSAHEMTIPNVTYRRLVGPRERVRTVLAHRKGDNRILLRVLLSALRKPAQAKARIQ